MTDDAQKVTIRRQWNDWKIAEAPLAALSGFRWDNFSGGVGRPSPQFHVHAYVNCDDVVGDISHSCLHGQGPHSIKVVILKKDNDREVMDHIIGIVGPRPKKAAKKKEGAK